jgi:hypothetical protein
MKNEEKRQEGTIKTPAPKTVELKTEPPISEKDEVKKAEARTNKPIRHHL